MYIQIETFISAVTSHKKAEGEISKGDAIAYRKNNNSSQEVKLQVKFPAKKNNLKL